MRPRRLRWGASLLAVGLVLGAAAGTFAAQQWPDVIPQLAHPGGGGLDRVTFAQALHVIQSDYYYQKLDYNRLSQGSIAGMVQALNDPFSQYLTPDQFRKQLNGYAGKYSGIGIYVNFTGTYPQITGTISGSPAEAAGLHAQDQITAIDGHPTKGVDPNRLSGQIQGPDGSTVKLTILRGTSVLTISVRRAPIKVPFVRWVHLEGQVLYVRLYSFGDGTASELEAALRAGLPGATGLILDLRDDPGGFIDAAQTVISEFVTGGEAFELRDRSGAVERHDVTGTHLAPSIQMVVLVNANSASASEMVAGSLRVHHRATLVGDRTFGKGSVQQDFQLPDGGDLHLTIRRWFLPDGSSVQGNGLKPDVAVALAQPSDEFDARNPSGGHVTDTQLNAALAALGAPH